MEALEILDESIVKEIIDFKTKKWETEGLADSFPNVILRGDVLQVLNRYCTVVYYPLEGENNNGFHISDIIDAEGVDHHFVYINTAQSAEKQIFTASHELGHIWNIEDRVLDNCGKYEKIKGSNSQELDTLKERIVNRFAAELLMPEKEFKYQFNSEMGRIGDYNKAIPLLKFLRVVSFLMNYFLAPQKAVLIRMVELGLLSLNSVNMLITDDVTSFSTAVNKEIDRIIREEGYTDLYVQTNKKYIEGLAELLDCAEREQSISEEKINVIRLKFDLISEADEPELDTSIEVG